MQSRNRVFDDLARVTNGAASVLSGFRDEAEARVRRQLERILAEMDVVPREEFEAVREMAANARREQETLSGRVAELETQIAALAAADQPRRTSRKRGGGETDSPTSPAADPAD